MKLQLAASTTAKLSFMLVGFLMPSAYSQANDICLDQFGNDKGPSGFQELFDDEGRIRLDRRGGELCGCSFVSYNLFIYMRENICD